MKRESWAELFPRLEAFVQPHTRLSGRWPEFKEEKETGGKSLFLIYESGLWKKLGRLEKPYESKQAPDGGYNHLSVLNSDTSLALMKPFPSIKLLRRRPGKARTSPSKRSSAESLISPARRRSLVDGFAHHSSCGSRSFAIFPILVSLLFFKAERWSRKLGLQH